MSATEPLFAGATPPAPGSATPDLTRYFVVELGPGAGLADALDAYAATPGVASAQPVGIFPVSYTPNDPLLPGQYAFGQPAVTTVTSRKRGTCSRATPRS